MRGRRGGGEALRERCQLKGNNYTKGRSEKS